MPGTYRCPAETGFYYLNSRYYDPATRRFISPDSIDVLTATANQPNYDTNLYAYCDNNPVMRVDRGGEFWDTLFDVVSLVTSVVDVVQNPSDPTAWAGLAADVVCLATPGLTGGGAVVKAVTKADDVVDVVKTVNKVDDVVDTAKAAKNLHRPYIRKSTRQAVEAAAPKLSDGRYIDPNMHTPINGKYDLGHVAGHEFNWEKNEAMKKGWSQKQFNDYMNDPSFYQIEDPHWNRSHKFEMRR